MARAMVLLYSVFSYLVSLASFVYAIGWLGGFLVPKTIDSGTAGAPLASALIDVLLLSAFALQHSVMARPAFKAIWTRIIPPVIERSTYVLASSVVLFAVCLGWHPLPAIVWRAEGAAAALWWGLFALGWAIVLASTFMISHVELFGLRQAWRYARGRAPNPTHYVERFLYRFVRHPIMLGFVIAFWAAPTMTQSHLLFASVATLYILVALQLEERDLLREHGAAYEEYRARVPMLIPGMKGARRR